jgi:ferric-dicitrate binding protein FerR (iron transport regulator)
MTERCARWMMLSDRQLLGEELAESELDLVRRHEGECVHCGREAALLRELRRVPLHVVPSEDEVRRILLQAEVAELDEPPLEEPQEELPRPVRVSPRKRRLAAGATLLALAASLLLLFKQLRPVDAPPARAHVPAAGSAHAGPAREVLPRALASRATEDTCGPVAHGIVLCLAAGSEVGRVELQGPKRVVELKRGRAVASLNPQPPGSSFSIAFRGGEVQAIGTVFSVQLEDDGAAYARVVRGKVLVRAKDMESEQALLAGQQLRLGATVVSALPLVEAERDLELLGRWVSVTDLGDSHAESSPQDPDAQQASGSDSLPTIKDELGRARDLRARGLFTPAATIYRSIHARSPGSESGRAALMSLASLQLSSLGDPRGALASFEAYLAGGSGPLRRQAEYGKIRALRRLGRTAEELEATRKFITRYPNAPEARLLKERVNGSTSPQ